MDKGDILEMEKIPMTKHKYVGIEIEFVCEKEDYEVEEILLKENLHYNCNLKGDSSIDEEYETKEVMPKFEHACRAPGFNYIAHDCAGCEQEENWDYEHGPENRACYAHELTILAPENELKVVLDRVQKVLKKIGAEVNSSCGLHVHLDMRNRNFKTCVNRLVAKQKQFRKMVAKNRLDNTYCKALTKQEAELAKQRPTSVDRYRDINVAAYADLQTIEVRLHEGCVNTKEIYNWCRYLISVIDAKKVSKGYVQKRTMECA